jgi:hypothetical protein
VFEHFDLVIECDVQTPAQILCRDVVLVPVCAAVEAAFAPAREVQHRLAQRFDGIVPVCTQTPPTRRPRSTTSTLFLSFAA